MKLYTFLDENEKIIEQVRAENHDQAVMAASHPNVAFDTDFYSETIEEDAERNARVNEAHREILNNFFSNLN